MKKRIIYYSVIAFTALFVFADTAGAAVNTENSTLRQQQNYIRYDQLQAIEGGGGGGGGGGTTTVTCGPGKYRSGSSCYSCPAGKYKAGTNTNTSCTACPAGTYSSSGASSCTDCPAGKYSSGTGNTSCTSCPAGSFTSGSGSNACVLCSPGKYNTGSGSNFCVPCPTGTYTAGFGSNYCIGCSAISIEHGLCTSCSTSGSCTDFSCDSGYTKSGSSCVAQASGGVSGNCPSGMIKSDDGNSCNFDGRAPVLQEVNAACKIMAANKDY